MKDIKIIRSNRKLVHSRFIVECTKALYMYHVHEFNDTVDYKRRFKMDHYMAPKDRFTYIILYKNKPVGIFTVFKGIRFNYIWRFFIQEEYRSKGIGSEVLKYIRDNMFPEKNLSINTHIQNTRAADFYKSLGFKFVGLNNDNIECCLLFLRDDTDEA